jgi:hypothetical protein
MLVVSEEQMAVRNELKSEDQSERHAADHKVPRELVHSGKLAIHYSQGVIGTGRESSHDTVLNLPLIVSHGAGKKAD